MVIRWSEGKFVKKRFNLGMRFQSVMCVIACGLGLLKDAIHMQVFDGGMDFQLSFELAVS